MINIKTYSETSGLLPKNSKQYVPPSFGLWPRTKNWLIRIVNNFLFKFPYINVYLNRFYQNRAAAAGKNRPYALSCKADYTSYETLTDYSFYGRHLPPAEEGYTKR
jgi:hypothetical protein